MEKRERDNIESERIANDWTFDEKTIKITAQRERVSSVRTKDTKDQHYRVRISLGVVCTLGLDIASCEKT